MSVVKKYSDTLPDSKIIQYACPKKCGGEKLFPRPGLCPLCNEKLWQVRDGYMEHADHNAKHGGVFFMSSDLFHHVEGTLESGSEFRLYFYDNFTTPLAAEFDAIADVRSSALLAMGTETVRMKWVDGENYCTAKIPAGFVLPITIAVRVKFKESGPAELFNFSFNSASKMPAAIDSVTDWAPTQ